MVSSFLLYRLINYSALWRVKIDFIVLFFKFRDHILLCQHFYSQNPKNVIFLVYSSTLGDFELFAAPFLISIAECCVQTFIGFLSRTVYTSFTLLEQYMIYHWVLSGKPKEPITNTLLQEIFCDTFIHKYTCRMAIFCDTLILQFCGSYGKNWLTGCFS